MISDIEPSDMDKTYQLISDPIEIGDQPLNIVKRDFQSSHKRFHPILSGRKVPENVLPPPHVWPPRDTFNSALIQKHRRHPLMEDAEVMQQPPSVWACSGVLQEEV